LLENKSEKASEQKNKTAKTSLITQLVFVLLFVIIVATIANQIKLSMDANKVIISQAYIELPDRKSLPIVSLEQAGKGKISTEMLKGKWHMLLFGYTFCPDVCPVELTVLHQMMAILRTQISSEQLPQIVFISIDPERDSPEIIADYVKYFDPDFIGLTGNKKELQILTMPLGITWMKQKNALKNNNNIPVNKNKTNENYLISHTTTIILVNPKMKVAGLFPAPHSAQEMAKIYRQVIEKEAL